MAHAAGKRTRAAARSHAESPERTANLEAGGRIGALAVWRSHRGKPAPDTASRLAGFEAFFGVGNCVWLTDAVERLAGDVRICRSEGPVRPRGAMTASVRAGPRTAVRRAHDRPRPEHQPVFSPSRVCGVRRRLAHRSVPLENGDDREEHNLILRYFG
jgi:hypothetical protein